MLDGMELFGLGYSWGGYESLIIPFDCSSYRTATAGRPAARRSGCRSGSKTSTTSRPISRAVLNGWLATKRKSRNGSHAALTISKGGVGRTIGIAGRGPALRRSSMLKLAAAALILLAPVSAFADTFPIPGENPVATVTIPEAWGPKAYEGGVEATSPDGKVYIAVEGVAADDVKDAVKEGIEWFDKQGVEIDADSMKTHETKGAEGASFEMTFTGKDKDGPTAISMTLVPANVAKKFLLIYFWGAPADADANRSGLKAIGETLQLTK